MGSPLSPRTPDDILKDASPPSGPPVPNMGGIAPPKTTAVRPPAVMGPMSGTNGRPRTAMTGESVGLSDGLTAGGAGRSPFRLPGPPPPPVDFPQDAPAAPGAPLPAPGPAPASPGQPNAPVGAVGNAPQVKPMLRPQMAIRSTAELPPGQEVDTQVGKAYKDPATGEVATTLNSAGKAAHQATYASQLQRFGSYHGSDDPMHPKPFLVPGEPAFNPDSGEWIE